MVRGIERRSIFLDVHDRLDLLTRLERVLEGSGARCYAWALMPNHFHLVLRPKRVPLSRLMARIGTGYARRFNERHDRVGHLFQNRFRSRIVEDDADLVGVVRYVHLNPLAGGIVNSLGELETHPWCGHGALLAVYPVPGFQAARETLALFGEEPSAARRALRSWMHEGWTHGLEPEAIDPEAPARADVARRSLARDARWDALLGRVGARFDLPREALCNGAIGRRLAKPRAVLAYLGVQRLGLGVCEVAGRLGISPAAASRAVSRGRSLVGPVEP